MAEAEIYMNCSTLAPVLPLAASGREQHQLRYAPCAPLQQKGRELIEDGTVGFKNNTWQQTILDGAI